MKKFLIILSLCLVGFTTLNKDQEEISIPNEAIRFRVIAESNSIKDQETKQQVKEVLQKDLTSLLASEQSIDTTRTMLKNNLNHFENLISHTLLQKEKNPHFTIHYGLNYFPQKKYKGITYEEGYYESLVVTLGAGNGENWWCVLFPPLCLLEAEDTNQTEVEYQSFVKELINKYIPN